jgi:hypothetical protein
MTPVNSETGFPVMTRRRTGQRPLWCPGNQFPGTQSCIFMISGAFRAELSSA